MGLSGWICGQDWTVLCDVSLMVPVLSNRRARRASATWRVEERYEDTDGVVDGGVEAAGGDGCDVDGADK